MSKKIKNEQKKFLGETLNQYDKALDEAINQLDKKNREQNHKISSLVNSFDNEYLEKDIEGNMTTLENSKDGMVIINEIQGNTEVNYCKDGEKELILNGDIDTQGESFVTITESVDGGLVDVSLEGNTEINLSKTKDPVLVTREFDDINCNVGKLQYTIDDVTTINDEPGKVDIDRIVGDTMVNHAVNGSEELILNAHINESGDNSITLNGVTSDGGKVDVALEGNTLVNVSKTKDSTAISKSYTVENSGNHVALQGEYDGKCRPVITGNTLVNLWTEDCSKTYCTFSDNTIAFTLPEIEAYPSCISKLRYNLKPGGTYTVILSVISLPSGTDLKVGGDSPNELPYFSKNITQTGLYKKAITIPSDKTDNTLLPIWSYTDGSIESDIVITKPILLEGDYTDKPIPDYFTGLQSTFEDNLVTQEMVDSGKEVADNLGKYKVEYYISGKPQRFGKGGKI